MNTIVVILMVKNVNEASCCEGSEMSLVNRLSTEMTGNKSKPGNVLWKTTELDADKWSEINRQH